MTKLINEIARSFYANRIKNGLSIDLTRCPDPITDEMLHLELDTSDKKIHEKIDRDYLWNQYLYINTVSTNRFGFVNSPFDEVEPWRQDLYTKTKQPIKNQRKSSTIRRGYNKYKSKTYRAPTPYRVNNRPKRRSQTYSTYSNKLIYGGGRQERMTEIIDCLNSGIYPHWSYSTIVKIADINNKPIYARGTSLPEPDKPSQSASNCNRDNFCTNTLNFYRYIKNIPKIISLQGCDLDWSKLDWSKYKHIYQPKYCENLNEKAIWNRICNEYDNITVPSQMRNDHMTEYYWVDMSAGFFSLYNSISDIDFTDRSNYSIIHCLAGYGRTGTILMLIICINYYKDNKDEFDMDFLTHEPDDPDNRKTSNRIIRKLKWLFHQYVTLDQEIDRSIPIDDIVKDRIKLQIASFDVNKIHDELFTHFYRRGSRNRQINYTSLNVLITRINYIIYFTTRSCGVEEFYLYETHQPTATRVDNTLVMDSLILSKPSDLISRSNVDVIVKNPVTQEIAIRELSKRGFDFVFFTRATRTNGSSSRRRRNVSRSNNTPSLINTDLVPVQSLTNVKIKGSKCVIS
jgi:hypothetical protein